MKFKGDKGKLTIRHLHFHDTNLDGPEAIKDELENSKSTNKESQGKRLFTYT